MAPKKKTKEWRQSQLLKKSGGIEERGERGRAYINLGRSKKCGPMRATVAEAAADLARAQRSASKDDAVSYLAALKGNADKGTVVSDKDRYRARVCFGKYNPIQGPFCF